MANYTINVVVSGAGGGGQGSGQQGGAGTSAASAVAGFAVKNLLQSDKSGLTEVAGWAFGGPANLKIPNDTGINAALKRFGSKMSVEQAKFGNNTFAENGRITEESLAFGTIRGATLFRRPSFKGIFMREGFEEDPNAPGGLNPIQSEVLIDDITYGNSLLGTHIIENRKRYSALLAATAYKTIQSAVAITQHQSGDAYQNQQINNGLKFAGYASALAFSGPVAPFVAAGIAINETVNAFTGIVNYNFDRKLDRQEITNSLVLAGNASYGRNRGVGF